MREWWKKLSPLEIGFLLMLLVLVPLFILLLAAYIISVKKPIIVMPCNQFCNTGHRKSNWTPHVNKLILKERKLDHDEIDAHNGFNSADQKLLIRRRDYPLQKVCESEVTRDTDQPFIAALIQVEEVSGFQIDSFKYLCSSAIVSEMWVVSSMECFKTDYNALDYPNTVFVRVVSKRWSSGGVLHSINKILNPPSYSSKQASIIAVQVKEKFMPYVQLLPIQERKPPRKYKLFSVDSSNREEIPHRYRGVGDVLSWNGDERLSFKLRKRNETLRMDLMDVIRRDECVRFRNVLGVFCARSIENHEGRCEYMSGAPLVMDGVLAGVHLAQTCISGQNVHYFLDVAKYYRWLKLTTNLKSL